MSSQRSPTKGPLPKHSKSPTQISNPPPKSPLKPLPSPLKGSITSLYAEHDLWSFKILDEPVPKGSKEPDPEYHANPDEISLGSSEDAEQAGPDPQLLIEEIHDYVISHTFSPFLRPSIPFPQSYSRLSQCDCTHFSNCWYENSRLDQYCTQMPHPVPPMQSLQNEVANLGRPPRTPLISRRRKRRPRRPG